MALKYHFKDMAAWWLTRRSEHVKKSLWNFYLFYNYLQNNKILNKLFFFSRDESLVFEDSLCTDLCLIFSQGLSQWASSFPQGSSSRATKVLPHQPAILTAGKMSRCSCIKWKQVKKTNIAERRKQEVTFRHDWNSLDQSNAWTFHR